MERVDSRPGPSASTVIEPARIVWRDGQPYSTTFQDIYHAPDGAEEVERVFLGPANVQDKLSQSATRQTTLRVGELGFGTGLNFAVAAERAVAASVRLHFVSFEAHPIEGAMFDRIAGERAARQPIYRELSERYPPMIPGWHRRRLVDGRVTLSLYWGDAITGLRDIVTRQRQPMDAWFLDGFAPDRNPAMWTDDLLGLLPKLSCRDTSVATFTAAGRVRRALTTGGFAMRRVDQRPHKRESLAGVFTLDGLQPTPRASAVAVCGAGIAGASTARHLADQGIAVAVFDIAARIAAGASQIPSTVLHGRLMGDGSLQAELRSHAFLYSADFARNFRGFEPSGALQVQGPNLDRGKLERIAGRYTSTGGWVERLNNAEAVELSGWPVDGPALYFPTAGVIDTPELCRALLEHPLIELHLNGPLPEAWEHTTVLACGTACRTFAHAEFLEITDVTGQLDIVVQCNRPTLPLVGDGYLVPNGGRLAVGATYEHQPWTPAAATAHNLRQLAGRPYQWSSRYRAARCIASDRTAVAGELTENCLVTTAHGSMGMVTAPYCAALVASRATGDFAPMTGALEALLAPERFRDRQARRGLRHGL